jgi:hypothetical protein
MSDTPTINLVLPADHLRVIELALGEVKASLAMPVLLLIRDQVIKQMAATQKAKEAT